MTNDYNLDYFFLGLDRTFHECDNHMYRLGPRSLPKGLKLDGGSDWVCLSIDFIKYLLTEKDELLQGLFTIFDKTLLPAESFFHTTLRNSRFCGSFMNNNLRITNWKRALGCQCQHKAVVDWCGCSPNIFTENDWKKISNSQSRPIFFARKFDATISQTVMNDIDQWVFDTDWKDYESYEKFWLNIFHHLDDKSEENNIVDFAEILINLKVSTKVLIKEVNVLFINDEVDSILVVFQDEDQNELEYRFKISENMFKVTENREILTIGSNFDVKETIFRSYIPLISSNPQFLVETEKLPKTMVKNDEKLGTILWISPFGNLESVNQSFPINVTTGHKVINANLPKIPGIWTSIYIDESNTLTELEFILWSKNIKNLDLEPTNNLDVITGHEEFLESVKKQKNYDNHHSMEAIKNWINKKYKLNGSCQLKQENEDQSCHNTDWSTRSPDPKSTIVF